MFLIWLALHSVLAAYNCSQITAANLPTWDLSPLFKSYYNLTIAVVQHEAISIDSYDLLFDLCKPVGSSIAEKPSDTCGVDAWACRLLNNYKEGDLRILSAKLYGASEPTVDPSSNKDRLIINMNGGDNNLTITFECSTDHDTKPVLEKYLPATMGLPGVHTRGGQIFVNWKSSAACALTLGSGAVTGSSRGSSVWSYLFWGTVIYFAGGIAFNYYQSKEFRIPHEKFWIGVKDNILNVWHSLLSRCGGPSHSQYVEI